MADVFRAVKDLLRTSAWTKRAYFSAATRRTAGQTSRRWRGVACTGARKAVPLLAIGARYGRETLGNKLILLGLLRACHAAWPARPVLILSAAPLVTRATLDELIALVARVPGEEALKSYLESVVVVPEEQISRLGSGDVLLIGGGPLSDDPQIVKLRLWAEAAQRAGVRTVVAGCGIGPSWQWRGRAEILRLLRCADLVLLRNRPPPSFAKVAGWHHVPDPALLCHDLLRALALPKEPIVAVNARSVDLSGRPDGVLSCDAVVAHLLRAAAPLVAQGGLEKIQPFTMYEELGEEDSPFSQAAAAALARRFALEMLPLSRPALADLIAALARARVAICVRHHGFLVALMLGCECLVLDYDAVDGKSRQFLREWLGRAHGPSLFVDRPDADMTLIDPGELVPVAQAARTRYFDALIGLSAPP